MSKLLIAFVHDEDATLAAERLRAEGHRFTLLPSVGGYLGATNATFVFGVEDEVAQEIIGIFEDVCHGREVELPLVLTERLEDWQARTVTHGGATILISDLDRIVRI